MTKRKIVAEDIFSIELVGDNARHPSKPKAAVVTQRLDEKENRYQSHIWMVSTEDGSKTLFTNGEKSETAPAWSPDGQWLAFLSNRAGDEMQVYLIPESGGEAIQVTHVKEGVDTFQWSPDGKRIALLSKVEMDKKSAGAGTAGTGAGSSAAVSTDAAESVRQSGTVEEVKTADNASDHESGTAADGSEKKDNPREKFTKDVLHIQRSFYRLDGVGFFGNKRSHLFVVNVTALVDTVALYNLPTEADGIPKLFPCQQVTAGEFDIDSFDFSPDGDKVVVATNVNEDAERTFKQMLYLLDVPAESTGTVPISSMHCLTPGFQTAAKPRYSPNGRFVAFKGENHQFGPTTLTGLYLYDFESEAVTWLTQAHDEIFENRSITDTRTGTQDALLWSADGTALYTLLSRRGTTQLVKVKVDGGDLAYLTEGNHCVLSYSFAATEEEVVLTVSSPLDPANVYAKTLAEGGVASSANAMRKLTAWNEEFLGEINLAVPERFEFENDGLTLDGWIMRPDGDAPADGYPAVLEVHGGPAAMYSDSFFFEFQLLAASGMAVVYTNPRGSVGYGQEFASCIEMDWGNLDFKDVEKLMDTALERYPLNPSKLAIAGGSYGGFMSAWAIGQTKRYKAAVVMRAVINWYSMMASDIGYVSPAEEFGGKAPWDDPERYMRISPITYVNNVETSTLIVHSENDYRCPIDQGEQFYIALKLRGIPVEFLRFPDESHGLSRNGKPWHRVVRLEKIAEFLRRELSV